MPPWWRLRCGRLRTLARVRRRITRRSFLARCQAIAAGRVVHRSCRMAFADSLSDDLRYATCGRHYVIFTETDYSIRVIDFLHQSADIARRLGV